MHAMYTTYPRPRSRTRALREERQEFGTYEIVRWFFGSLLFVNLAIWSVVAVRFVKFF